MLNKIFSSLITIIVSGIVYGTSFTNVFAANGHPDMFSGNFETNCGGANVSVYEYFPGPSTTKVQRIFDEFWWPELAYIRDNSQIYTWDGNGGSLGGDCKNAANWIFPSNVTPGNNIHATVLENDRNCTFTRNNDPTRPFGQFNFRLSYATSAGILQPVSMGDYSYWQEGGAPGVANRIPDQRKRIWTPARSAVPQFHANECLNIYARWCGDGIVEPGNETCDLGAQNGQPGSTCSIACTTQTVVACIPGTTTGSQIAPITAATPGLCPVGQIVGGFTSTVVGTTTNYSWSCNGSPVGGACIASYTPTTVACIAGTVTGSQATSITAATAGLCPAGQTVGGFTSTVVGATTNYAWSCNGNNGGNCNASYTTSGNSPLCTPGNFVRDSGGVVTAPITTATAGLCPAGQAVGNFTDTTNGTSHRYSWSCNAIGAGLACTAFYNPSGAGNVCQIGSIIGVQSTPINTNTPGLCLSGLIVSNFQSNSSNGSTVYSWSCNGISGCSSTYTPSLLTIPGSNSYCGNGIIERPNSAGNYETCDTSAAWCDSSCQIVTTNPGTIPPGQLIITTPGGSPMDVGAAKLIIGNQVPVFLAADTVAFETNTPMYLQNKVATITNKSPLITGNTLSKNINNVGVGGTIRFKTGETRDMSGNLLTVTYTQSMYPSTITLFPGVELQGFKGDTSSIVSGSYKDVIASTPLYKTQGFYASLQYLESPFHIRVSKPIIGNTAGGSAFIGSPLGYNVNTIVQAFLNNLRTGNFTTSTINTDSSYALSSATKSVSGDSVLSETITSGGQKEEGKILNSSLNTLGTSSLVTRISSSVEIDSKSSPLGDTTNIRVFKEGDVSIDGDMSLAGVKTVVIENGNLIINKDMSYANKTSSFAWIVKNGNIIIADSVQNIAGVYVTIAGAIVSNGVTTPNRLTVDGSLYGNTIDLVTNRTYVRGQTDYTALNVGVVIDYSNRAIMYPPPFLSRFLEQYSLQRVAR